MTQFETIAWYTLITMNIVGVIVFLLIGVKIFYEYFKKEEQ
jgi:putative Mn2+ efflux pump MntP